jgi:2-polyprenyl-6-methoxyphenol hydroxylase-like FAD-dependent oxidoreductase
VTLKIAIVGGGIGGLAAAAFLNQAGLSATVYEQTRELREIGAGLSSPRTWPGCCAGSACSTRC